MQVQIDEANSMVIIELEAARNAIEEAPPFIEETPVIIQHTERVDSLTAEVERLKVQLLCGIIFTGCLNVLFQSIFGPILYNLKKCRVATIRARRRH
jgi:hypothetical protein